MTELTIGIPVFNGAALLPDAIACVQGQQLGDVRILVSDNASDDGSFEIAQALSRKDDRITVYRQRANVGSLTNMQFLLMQAETPFFAWRAHDDLSESNFFVDLLEDLKSENDKGLAAPIVHRIRRHGETDVVEMIEGHELLPRGSDFDATARRVDMIVPAWFYGVWRTEVLRNCHIGLSTRYGLVQSHDPLLQFGLALRDGILSNHDSVLLARLKDGVSDPDRSSRTHCGFYSRIRHRDAAWIPFVNECIHQAEHIQHGLNQRRLFKEIILPFAQKHLNCTRSQFLFWQLRKLFAYDSERL